VSLADEVVEIENRINIHIVQGGPPVALWTNENERAGTHGHRTLRELGFVEAEFLLLIMARRSMKIGQIASYPPQWVYMILKLPFFLKVAIVVHTSFHRPAAMRTGIYFKTH
jgi:hypothetical protein